MFQKLEGGTIINIQGLECCIPPEGYIYNIATKKLEYRGVYSRSKVESEQYWEVESYPIWYKSVMKEWDDYDKKKKDDDEEFYDERLEKFKVIEWDKRLNGTWFKNNGKSTYLTGTHYFYLRYWMIDIGLPMFRIPDLEKAYFMQYCIEDPLSMGMVEITKRRFGKSFWAGVFLTEYVTRTKMTNGGVQSKTGLDGKKFFSKTVVNPFRRLPKFFRPEYDMSLGVNPKTEMRFQKTNIRGKKANENVDKDELGSVIDWGSADKVHYDGQKLHRIVIDEASKTVETNVYDRHEVLRYCLLDSDGKIIGKMLATTTVEKLDSEKDGVQEAFKLLWDESDQNKKKENGMTASGLYRFFMTARRTRNFDAYGFPNEELTEQQILLDREGVKDNQRALFARIRKEPLTIEEAFSIDADKCIFNSFNIADRERQLIETPIHKRSVWFYRDLDQKVRWRDITPKEKSFHWKITQFPTKGEENKFIIEDGIRKPARTKDGCIAIDGYSNSQGGQKWGSKASAWIGRRYDINDHENTNKAIGHLYGRPNEKSILNEQVLLAAEYYGYEAFWEHNSDDFYSFFKDRGRLRYLGKYPKILIDPMKLDGAERHYGVPTTPYSLTTQADKGVAYFENHCDKIDFEVLLDDAKEFDPNDRTKFDITVSFLILVCCLLEKPTIPPPMKTPLVKIYESQGIQ
jgi:hypothetical protein